MTPHDPSGEHEHDLGLRHDLPLLTGARAAMPGLIGSRPTGQRPIGRRRMLSLFAGAGLVTLAGCAAATGPSAGSGATAAAGEIPQETAGPFPGDGTNGPNVLTASGVVRSDITSSVGSLSGTAAGVPLAIDLTIVDASGGAVLPGATVYLWHCDREGRYSLYDVEDQNHLRGVQVADAAGKVGYSASMQNLARTSLDTDMVFRDGFASQLATVTGTLPGGLTAALSVPVAA